LPIIQSAKKRVRTAERKTRRNRLLKSRLKTAIRRFERAVEEGDQEKSSRELVKAQKIIDKSVGKGIIHKNNAARKKSRLTRLYNNIAS